MQNDWMLLIAQNAEIERDDKEALIAAGYPDHCIAIAHGDAAADYLAQRLHISREKRPGLIIVDLDHTDGWQREQLKSLVKSLKGSTRYRAIPLVMLLRGDHMREDVTAWYQAGVNAVALRPNSPEKAVDFYRAVSVFWRERVVLPERDWPDEAPKKSEG